MITKTLGVMTGSAFFEVGAWLYHSLSQKSLSILRWLKLPAGSGASDCILRASAALQQKAGTGKFDKLVAATGLSAGRDRKKHQ